MEKNEYRINHPEIIFKGLNSAELSKITNEFKETYLKGKISSTEELLDNLERLVYRKIPYNWNFLLPFPTLQEILEKKRQIVEGELF
jgi:hypothetical protein